MELLKKAFSILDLFLDHGNELALEDLSRLSGLRKATVRRLALTLIDCGYLKQAEKRGKYSLGMRFLDFSGAIKKSNRIIDISSPYLIELGRKVDETVMLILWDGMNAVLGQSYNTDHALKVIPEEGTRLGMHYTSAGKIILAEMTEDELDKYLVKGLIATTPNTITDLNNLKTHLAKVKKEGIALDDEEYAIGVRGIATGIRVRSGKLVGAITIVGPSVRLSRSRLMECVPLIMKCGQDISQALGYTKDKNNG
jgi:DNA-binding IclR family transcriptional regulator